MPRRGVWWINTSVSEETYASILKLEESNIFLRNGIFGLRNRIVTLVKELLSNLFIYLVSNILDFWIIVTNMIGGNLEEIIPRLIWNRSNYRTTLAGGNVGQFLTIQGEYG